MAATTSIARIHRDGSVLTFQVVGWAQMALSLPVRRCAEEGIAHGISTLRFDLRHCTYIDSTFLGTLLFLKRSLKRCEQGQLILLSPSQECCTIFHQVGVQDVFLQVMTDEPTCTWTELAREPQDPTSFNRNVVQAHQELASLGGMAGKQFQSVARCLETDESEKGRA